MIRELTFFAAGMAITIPVIVLAYYIKSIAEHILEINDQINDTYKTIEADDKLLSFNYPPQNYIVDAVFNEFYKIYPNLNNRWNDFDQYQNERIQWFSAFYDMNITSLNQVRSTMHKIKELNYSTMPSIKEFIDIYRLKNPEKH